jgi:hypothetical protein
MGNSYLEKPITTKKTSWGENKDYKFATCEMQGWRKNMEDAFIAELAVPRLIISLLAFFNLCRFVRQLYGKLNYK